MADEISFSLRFKCANGDFEHTHTFNKNDDQTTQGHSQNIQVIGTATHELLTINSDIGTAGWAVLVNLDAANFVRVGNDVSGTFSPLLKINAGMPQLIRLDHKLLYAKADTASVRLLVSVFEL